MTLEPDQPLVLSIPLIEDFLYFPLRLTHYHIPMKSEAQEPKVRHRNGRLFSTVYIKTNPKKSDTMHFNQRKSQRRSKSHERERERER